MECFNSLSLSPLIRSAAMTGIILLLSLLSACTEYERNGVNSRPFNEPTGWEQNPYGNAFRN